MIDRKAELLGVLAISSMALCGASAAAKVSPEIHKGPVSVCSGMHISGNYMTVEVCIEQPKGTPIKQTYWCGLQQKDDRVIRRPEIDAVDFYAGQNHIYLQKLPNPDVGAFYCSRDISETVLPTQSCVTPNTLTASVCLTDAAQSDRLLCGQSGYTAGDVIPNDQLKAEIQGVDAMCQKLFDGAASQELLKQSFNYVYDARDIKGQDEVNAVSYNGAMIQTPYSVTEFGKRAAKMYKSLKP